MEIARSILHSPPLLILDEATALLDSVVEQQILHNLKAQGFTLLIIAHRLSTIRNSDEIIVLEEGQVIERGTHQSLLELKGTYWEMVENA